ASNALALQKPKAFNRYACQTNTKGLEHASILILMPTKMIKPKWRKFAQLEWCKIDDKLCITPL
ncbi:hypothetical protein, partial [Helicobacter mehlei]|uniref:hypothetical protein n=1 Tax=Helicobacter mehlei TaxID=2316080 RepID=UPI00196969F5